MPIGGQAMRTPLPVQPESPVPTPPPSAPPPSSPPASPPAVTAEPAPPPKTTAPQSQPAAVIEQSGAAEAPSSPTASSQRLDLNTADVRTLRKLPQVTRSRARAIVKGRPYESVADLVGRKVISKKAYAAIKDLVEVR
ncbi:ComEA family DNA-binding protein [Methylobacterium iners]|uniref:ComEA family DNA-binding protein n=1 Tax=Methylobacterium iners TaxID=418707 RepID=UPI0035A23CBD